MAVKHLRPKWAETEIARISERLAKLRRASSKGDAREIAEASRQVAKKGGARTQREGRRGK